MLGIFASVLIVFQNLFHVCRHNIAAFLSQCKVNRHFKFLPKRLNDVIPEHPHIFQSFFRVTKNVFYEAPIFYLKNQGSPN